MTKTTCPAGCPCLTADPRNERLLADEMLARCKCGDVVHLDAPESPARLCPGCAEEQATPVAVDDDPTVAETYETIEAVSAGWHGRLFGAVAA